MNRHLHEVHTHSANAFKRSANNKIAKLMKTPFIMIENLIELRRNEKLKWKRNEMKYTQAHRPSDGNKYIYYIIRAHLSCILCCCFYFFVSFWQSDAIYSEPIYNWLFITVLPPPPPPPFSSPRDNVYMYGVHCDISQFVEHRKCCNISTAQLSLSILALTNEKTKRNFGNFACLFSKQQWARSQWTIGNETHLSIFMLTCLLSLR